MVCPSSSKSIIGSADGIVTVEKPDSDQYFVPGKIGNPDPERNALFQAGSGLSIFLGTKY